jgi:hypothetical protein
MPVLKGIWLALGQLLHPETTIKVETPNKAVIDIVGPGKDVESVLHSLAEVIDAASTGPHTGDRERIITVTPRKR